ncbi:hypothetical protein PUN28_011213 [Cardiocondyla obscurior]|uniref:THAP-type domain-containing protein n=3 Tax=Cardiocondyla obscurior TaxID=286306 RepID=A0AAW2FJU5_9HYME
MVKVCSICKEEQTWMNSHLVFHSLPKNPDVRKQWLEVLKKRETVKAVVVCSNHFRPEDYRELCNKPLLKMDAVPRLDICESDACVESIEKSPTDFQESVDETDHSEETIECVNKSQNIENVSIDESESEMSEIDKTDETNKTKRCLKRKNDSNYDKSGVVSKKRCNLKKLGMFRKEEFNDENLWNRFLVAFEAMKKEKALLERKNKRLFEKVQKYRHIVEELKEKNLLSELVADMLNIR